MVHVFDEGSGFIRAELGADKFSTGYQIIGEDNG